VSNDVGANAALMLEVEVLDGFAGRETGGPDAGFAAVGLAGRDLPLQTGGKELLVTPGLGPARSPNRSTPASNDGAFSSRHR